MPALCQDESIGSFVCVLALGEVAHSAIRQKQFGVQCKDVLMQLSWLPDTTPKDESVAKKCCARTSEIFLPGSSPFHLQKTVSGKGWDSFYLTVEKLQSSPVYSGSLDY